MKSCQAVFQSCGNIFIPVSNVWEFSYSLLLKSENVGSLFSNFSEKHRDSNFLVKFSDV